MQKYGYIDDKGHLNIEYAQEKKVLFKNLRGEEKERTISIEESIELLEAKGYKLVEPKDESKMECPGQEYYLRVPVPYDKGEVIGYRYEKRFDFHKVELELEALKSELAKSDIKITRFHEALIVDPMTSDSEIKELIKKREGLREQIRELQALEQTEREKQAKELGLSPDFKIGHAMKPKP